MGAQKPGRLSLAKQSWVKYNSRVVNTQPHLALEPETEESQSQGRILTLWLLHRGKP